MISALRYELRRITTLRSTWVMYACAVGFVALFAILQVTLTDLTADATGRVPLDLVLDNAINPIAILFIATLAAMSFGHEYRHGIIRLTLTSLPRRGQVFAAKAIVIALASLVGYALMLGTAYLVAVVAGDTRVQWISLGKRSVTSPDGDLGEWSSLLGEDLLRSAAYVVGYSLIAFAVAALTRSLALGILIPLAASVMVEPLLIAFLETRLLWLNDVLPFSNAGQFLDWYPTGDAIDLAGDSADPMAPMYGTGNPISPVQASATFGAWITMLLAAAYALFGRRDA